MRLYNASLETIVGGYDGINFFIDPGKTISVSEVTGQWILSHNRKRGLVELSPPNPLPTDFDFQGYLVKQTLKGLEAYVQMLEDILESFINLDTELKSQNVYGTVLKSKRVKETNKMVEYAIATMKDLEAKYGISIMKKEMEEKSRLITDSIEATVAMFEADTDAQKKAKDQESEIDQIIKEMLPNEVFSRSQLS